MTRDETKKILYIMTTTWPNFKPKVSSDFVDVWHEMIGDLDYHLAAAALKAYAQQETSGFAPSVGQLREKAVMITQEEEMTDGEAWALVVKAIGRSSYYASEEFDKLPSVVRRAVGGPEALRGWAMSEDGLDFIRGSFMRSFNAAKQAEKQKQQLSADLFAAIYTRKGAENEIPQQED